MTKHTEKVNNFTEITDENALKRQLKHIRI